ncbi:MAG TPA: hypothetical protein EYP23_02495, partial [Thermoplasmata archaeon]|nr:hypothetical protein [Thermoplasmata archaeon]
MRDVIQDSASEYDIMIVGGGPAGLSTWLHLHKYDPDLASKTVLIEKAKYPRDKLCGGALGEYTETILKQLKIDITIPSIQIHRVKCRVGDEVFCRKKHNYFKIIRRLEFDHALAQTAIARGLRLHENETFIEMKTQKDGVVVKTSRQKYRTRVLIGADGSTSEVRRKMNLPKKPRFATAIEIFTTVNPQYDKELTTNTVSFDFSWVTAGLQGYVWHFPCIVNNNPSMNHGIGNFRFFPDKPRADT